MPGKCLPNSATVLEQGLLCGNKNPSMLLIKKELPLFSLAPQLLHPMQFEISRETARRTYDAIFEGCHAALGNSWRTLLFFRERQKMVDAPRHGRFVCLGCSSDFGAKLGNCAVYLYPLLGVPCHKLACYAVYGKDGSVLAEKSAISRHVSS